VARPFDEPLVERQRLRIGANSVRAPRLDSRGRSRQTARTSGRQRKGGADVTRYHLAQVEHRAPSGPIEDPIMEGFRSQLDSINALADGSPGFVWRLQTEDGMPWRSDRTPTSEWRSTCRGESLEALQKFVYGARTLGHCATGSSG